MFLIRLFQFLKGYVIIELYGGERERFLSICAARGIYTGRVEVSDTAFRIRLSLSDFLGLRDVFRKTRLKSRIVKRCGLPFMRKRFRKRWVFLAGAVFFAAFIGVMSSFVWTVEIEGELNVPEEEILSACRRAGIYPGARKSELAPLGELKEIILSEVGELTWAWVNLEGVRARVEVRERTIPGEVIDKSQPCRIGAACDGLIRSVTVKNGEAAVKPGDAVLAGETLISPYRSLGTDDMGNPVYSDKPVHALGEVRAVTWHVQSGEYPLYHTSRLRTGEKKTRYSLELFSKTVPLYIGGTGFEEYETKERRYELSAGGNFLGIAVVREEIEEVVVNCEELSYEAAVQLAKYDLEEKISAELMPGAILENEQLRTEETADGMIRVTLEMQFEQSIGVELQA